jgi:hypothetical protein
VRGASRLPGLVVLAVFAALGLSACGGDNDPAGEPPTTTPPSPVETRPKSPEEKSFPASFAKKVDPICTKAQAAVDKVAATRARNEAAVQKLSSLYGDAATDLEALKPPEQNAAAYEQFTQAFRSGEDLFKRLGAEVERGDSSAYQRVPSTLDQVNTEIKDTAQQYGFDGCASD